MTEDRRRGNGGAPAAGTLRFGGWLFTIAYAHLLWWQAALGLVIWPYYVGVAVR